MIWSGPRVNRDRPLPAVIPFPSLYHDGHDRFNRLFTVVEARLIKVLHSPGGPPILLFHMNSGTTTTAR